MYIFVIKSLREKKNLTLYELSKKTGISRTYLRGLENNKKFNPTLLILYKIAKALQVNIKDLFYSLDEIEELKQELNHRVELYGTMSKEAMEVSQIIDLLINVKMSKD